MPVPVRIGNGRILQRREGRVHIRRIVFRLPVGDVRTHIQRIIALVAEVRVGQSNSRPYVATTTNEISLRK
jgi:hypothetical protein